MSARWAREEAEEFGDYWRGIPGHRGVKLDWPATWRNRIRAQLRFHGPGDGPAPKGGRRPQRRSHGDEIDAAFADAFADVLGGPPGGGSSGAVAVKPTGTGRFARVAARRRAEFAALRSENAARAPPAGDGGPFLDLEAERRGDADEP